ncbi:integrase [Pseudomonas syringae]|nr:tyrosine-type recombinase/integrase [Pseudomonas syringae]MBI6667155.1 tyrosine-type recombinase/integrase [Pseudomonas syringae]MBI6675756.1 tyrosine-type recombinase/integrase [Pseudomonas syringae]MBI6837229.1 tyrosine-type recombinase/integrase [Pseudomonas syringae]RXT76160.1 integrase [Pseudomonas syringae]RXT82679.1 integrase [Pseudomonas syringae]
MNARSANAVLKAYDVLVAQPVTASGLTPQKRDAIVISAIINEQGETLVLSRFGDAQWDFRPFFDQANVSQSFKFINWDMSMPKALVDDCKAVAYAWFKRGMPRSKPPIARGITTFSVASMMPFMRWLDKLGIFRFSDVRPIHISNYIHHCKNELKLRPLPLYGRLRVIDFLWVFAADTIFPLKNYPWGNSTLWRICGIGKIKGIDAANKNVGRTDIIPPDELSKIFNHSESIVLAMKSELAVNGIGYHPGNDQLSAICRDAVLFMVSITSGMRNDEAIGIEVGAWRRELKDGVLFCWVSTIEHKTGKGRVEYLVPELTLDALELLGKYSVTIRKELEQEIRYLSRIANPDNPAEHLLRLEKARTDSKKLFLERHAPCGRIEDQYVQALSGSASNAAFDSLAKAAGSDWRLRTHQCRRTYARTFVESRMGRTSLIYLKWQFKHSSMSMTQLYASNPQQDLTLFDEIFQQMTEFKIDLIESWLDDQPLAGGAGEKIVEMRAIPIKDRSSLLAQTAPHANIRATGHGWCIATERGCGGAGLYEATRCPGCKNSVIDEFFAATWQDIYGQQQELIKIVDAGPAVKQRAERDLQIAFDVITSLGLSPINDDKVDENGD